MNVTLGQKWESFVERVVAEGRFTSADAVVDEGLKLVAARESQITALRADIAAGLDSGEPVGLDVVDAELDALIEGLRREGF